MILYIEISSYVSSRAYSGIQRVVREFLYRVVEHEQRIEARVIYFDMQIYRYIVLDIDEVGAFVADPRGYEFVDLSHRIEIDDIGDGDIFLDMDAVWSDGLKRAFLYPRLHSQGTKIINFIHDMIPIIRPYSTHRDIVRNFTTFVDALYRYSDMVLFNSRSSQRDFSQIKEQIGCSRYIPHRVVKLGSSLFAQDDLPIVDSRYSELYKSRYLLFVGTIEPRKNQALLLDVFEELSSRYSDLHLVLIGIAGWSNDALIERISTHPLLGDRVHWFEYVDDDALVRFYHHAYISIYLSSYEGFGLPIAESLGYGNITITSKNSSIYEVGGDFADYILYDSYSELYDTISAYLDYPTLYRSKVEYIRRGYRPYSWESTYSAIAGVIERYAIGSRATISTPTKSQFVTISYDRDALVGAIESIDRYVDFVDRYLIITSASVADSWESISSIYPISIVASSGSRWEMISSLVDTQELDEQFVWFEDSYRAYSDISIDHFVDGGRYRAYYLYDMLDWHRYTTPYDKGIHATRELLDSRAMELLSYYSSIVMIDREILQEVIDIYAEDPKSEEIDICSLYLNSAISLYPYLFDREDRVEQRDHIPQIALYRDSLELLGAEQIYYRRYDMVHGLLEFFVGDSMLLLYSMPYYISIPQGRDVTIPLSYKSLGCEGRSIYLSYTISTTKTLSTRVEVDSYYVDRVVELDILSSGLRVGEYELLLDVVVDSVAIYGDDSPYLFKLLVG